MTKRGIRYLMVNLNNPASTPALRKFLSRYSIRGKYLQYHYRDPTYKAARLFQVNVYPSMAILDKNGEVAYFIKGSIPSYNLFGLLQRMR